MDQNSYYSQTGDARSAEPMIPLPGIGEGIPAYPGDDIASTPDISLPAPSVPAYPGGNDSANVPVTPLPNPGEGGAVYPGNDVPVFPLPNPGEGEPAYPGDDAAGIPVVPLPNPGEGGPVYPGNTIGGTISGGSNSGVTILPALIGTLLAGTARVRFLNAAYGYPVLRVLIGNSRFVNLLNYASVSSYGQVRAGYRTISIVGTDGYVYLQKTLPFQSNSITTVAIINSSTGMDIMQITDSCCPPTNGYSNFRIGNLAYNSTPLDVLMSDGRVVYSDLRFKEVAAFKRIAPGAYQFFYADTNISQMPAYQDIETLDSAWLGVYPPYETFGSLYLNVGSNTNYTVYLLQSGAGRNNIQNLILADR